MSRTSQQLLNRLLIVFGVALIVATGVVVFVHDGQRGDAEPQQNAAPAKAVDKVQIKDFLFEPDAITVSVGAKITFTNRDNAPHTATSGPSPNPDGVFDTGTLTTGQSKSIKATKAGTFAYYCALHPFMKGTVIVR